MFKYSKTILLQLWMRDCLHDSFSLNQLKKEFYLILTHKVNTIYLNEWNIYN